MNDYSIVGLYEHNIEIYKKIKEKLKDNSIVSIIQATGTGKTYNALQLTYENKDKKIIYLVPSNSIIEHIEEIIEENPKLNLEKDYPNLIFKTYQSLVDMSEKELENLDVDLLIIDEFHHIGAPIWGARTNKIIETHKNMKVLGMTAYTVRDRGTIYERDMIGEGEVFSNSVASNYDICDAIIDGVLPKMRYKSGYIYLEKTEIALEKRLESMSHNSKNYKELKPILDDVKRRLHEAKSLKDIFKTNIKPNGKYIYFCPVMSEKGKNDIETISEEVKTWIEEMGLTSEDYEIYITTSKMGKEGKLNRKAFYNDEDIKGNKVNNKLRIMLAINQYNEGVHAPGIDGVIMGRGTSSDIVFFEQLGRALSVRGKTKEEYEELSKKTKEELIEICEKREIEISDTNTKEKIIEQILAPVIIDLAGNIGFIKELESNLKSRVREIQERKSGSKRKIHIDNTSFDINLLNEDIFEILKYVIDRLSTTWMDKYELAKKYYEYYGNLDIPQKFKTINGIDYDENGIALGRWINSQRQTKDRLTNSQIELLENIEMIWNVLDEKWNRYYELARKYYEYYGNLDIPQKFKTINGIDYDENGIALGSWINTQRTAHKGKGNSRLTNSQIELLENIGMKWDMLNEKWNRYYEFARKYYEHNGNLDIPSNFKTKNGIDYDENGIALGSWISTQRKAYKGESGYRLTNFQIELLENIGMKWNALDEKWNIRYELAKKYYEHYGNLDIPQKFKTINGIDYDENGIALGVWISVQRNAYKGHGSSRLTNSQIELLESIGMIFISKTVDKKLQSEEISEKNIKEKRIELLNRSRMLLNSFDSNILPNKNDINEKFIEQLNNIKK